MRKHLIVCALFIATASAAAEYSDLYVVPIAGSTRGANGTSWRSDVVLHNIQSVPVSIEIAMVESGRAPSAAPVTLHSVQLQPGETRTLELGRDGIGALIAGASLPFALTSRTRAERTLGQSVTPVAIDAARDVAVLPALATNARQRSNVGVFVAASHAPLVVAVDVLSPGGATLASHVIVAAEPGFIHRQLPIESGTAAIRIVQGEGIVVPYASIIDNASAEAMFVSGAPIAAGPTEPRAMLARFGVRRR